MNAITLSLWERIRIEDILRSQRGDVGFVMKSIEIIKKLTLTEEEKVKIDFIKKDKYISWNNEKALSLNFSCEFTDDEFVLLEELVCNYRDWEIHDNVIALVEKFKGNKKTEKKPTTNSKKK